MKLQGKKTGALAGFIGYVTQASPTIDLSTGEIMLTVRYTDAGVPCYKDYKTIAEFNADWEDYEPDEPLIKDEKIRKAVRAWAKANGVERVFIGFNNRELVAKFREGQSISFGSSLPLDRGRNYTITELCGKEEK